MKTIEYERYTFKSIVQERSEALESFVGRLRIQAKKCQFTDVDSQLKDQVIAKCSSNDLRHEALQNPMSLEQLIFTGKTLELVERNSQPTRSRSHRRDSPDSNETLRRSSSNDRYTERQNFNKFRPNVRNNQRSPMRRDKNSECNRCGFTDHSFNDPKCPAMKGHCDYCKKPGHFSRMCWDTKFGNKRPRPDTSFDRATKMPRWTDDERNENRFGNSSTSSMERDPRKGNVTATATSTSSPNNVTENQSQTTKTVIEEPSQNKNESVGKIRIKSVESLSLTTNQQQPDQQKPNPIEKQITLEQPKSPSKVQETSKLIEMKQEVVTVSSSSPRSTAEKSYDCLVGGKAVKLSVDKNVPLNIMSYNKFKKLLEAKFKVCTMDMVPIQSGNYSFLGHFSSKIEINNLVQYINFAVRKGSESSVFVTRKMSEQLGLT